MNKQQTKCQVVTAVLWPSFIVAGLANTIFFTVFDPVYLVYQGGALTLSNMGVYSVGFFCFWLITGLSSLGTQYFMKPCVSLNLRKESDHK